MTISSYKQLAKDIVRYASFPQTGVSLHQFVKFGENPSKGTLLKASQFVLEELPVRLAHRVVELEKLPHGLSDMPSVKKVKHWYIDSFEDLLNFQKEPFTKDLYKYFGSVKYQLPKASQNSELEVVNENNINKRFYVDFNDQDISTSMLNENDKFVQLIQHIKKRHDPVVTTMAQGIVEFKNQNNTNTISRDIQLFLDRFYLSRIGIRMLLGQHISMHKDKPKKDYVGVVCTRTKPAQIITDAINDAKFICENYYSMFKAPEVILHCPEDLEFLYVPSHLHHMMFELLKNSLRAVIERFGEDCEEDYPDVKVIVAKGKEDITIKISDEGGGIPRSGMPMVWTYMYTTAQTPSLDPNFNQSDFKAPMAGFGYGLPISRLYARYFGGDLKLISMESYGTDAYLHLNRLSDSEEPLP